VSFLLLVGPFGKTGPAALLDLTSTNGNSENGNLAFVLGCADSLARVDALILGAERSGAIAVAGELLKERETHVALLNSALVELLRDFDMELAPYAPEVLPFLLESGNDVSALDALLPYMEAAERAQTGFEMPSLVAGLLLRAQERHGFASRYFERAATERFQLGAHAMYLAIECLGESRELERMRELERSFEERLTPQGGFLATPEERAHLLKKARILTGIALLGSEWDEEGSAMLKALAPGDMTGREKTIVNLALGRRFDEAGERVRAAAHYYEALKPGLRMPEAAAACEAYLSLVRRGSVSPDTRTLLDLANCLVGAREEDEATRLLAEVSRKNPRSRTVVWDVGRLFYRMREYRKAATEFRKLERLGRDAMDPHRPKLWRARCERNMGNTQLALKLFREVAGSKRGSASLEAGWELGLELESAGKLEEAVEVYDSLHKTFPRSGMGEEGFWRKGFVEFRRKRFEQARKAFTWLAQEARTQNLCDAGAFWLLKCDVEEGKEPSLDALPAETDEGKEAPGRSLYGVLMKRLRETGEAGPSFFKTLSAVPALETPRLGNAAPAQGESDTSRARSEPSGTGTEIMSGPPQEVRTAAMLFHLGLKELGEEELLLTERKFRQEKETLLLIAQLYWRSGLYRRGILLAQRLDVEDAETKRFLMKVSYPVSFTRALAEESRAQGVDPFLVLAVMKKESVFDATAVSVAGAVGLMQLMPGTAAAIASYLGHNPGGLDLRDPDLNIKYGVWYLGRLAGRYSGSIVDALAAYNAGEENAEKWRRRVGDADDFVYMESISFRETREYVRNVVADFHIYRDIYGTP
jgi:tetratricopeptide (TPR) repeat protein